MYRRVSDQEDAGASEVGEEMDDPTSVEAQSARSVSNVSSGSSSSAIVTATILLSIVASQVLATKFQRKLKELSAPFFVMWLHTAFMVLLAPFRRLIVAREREDCTTHS